MSTALRQQLVDLRGAILAKPEIIGERKKALNKRQSLRFTLESPNTYQIYQSDSATRLEKKFADPILNPYRKNAEKKATAAEKKVTGSIVGKRNFKRAPKVAFRVLASAFLVLATLAVLGGGGFLTYLVSDWSWETSISSFMQSSYLWDSGFTREAAIGIHMMSLSFALIVLGLVALLVGLRSDEDWVHTMLIVVAVIFWSLSLITLIVSVASYCSLALNVFEWILYIFSYLMFIPKAFFMWIYIIPFLFVPLATLIATGFAGFGCFKFIAYMKEIHDDETRDIYREARKPAKAEYDKIYRLEMAKAPEPDVDSFRKTQEYKDAVAFDKAEDEASRKRYKEKYNAEQAKYKELVSQYDYAIAEYDKLIQQCDRIIKDATFLNEGDKNVKMINIIIYYIDTRYATSVREALADWETDRHRMRMEQKMDALRRETTRRIEQGIANIERSLNGIETSITQGFNSINQNLDRNASRIERSIEEFRKQDERHAEHLSSSVGRIASDVGYIAEVHRRYN